ncbi:hypothetical protein [Nostoc cycadae]|uniref:Uncharacterized protein n=1 Tax=Nostoc cycadae WK-1 TaxID=1861711 RepID=A0A2H6LCI6_9NOSO|nr:hypothetical protein [Nostoc cycadae]GBE90941.1 hypothetical protein NCWK1_0661 [Nostoc cycadae WK-1]
MLNPVRYKTDEHRAYQQALNDFGITELLAKLKNYSDADFDSTWMQLQQQEIETLAAILISELTHSINGKLIAAYLHLIRHNHQDIAPGLINPSLRDATRTASPNGDAARTLRVNLKYPDASIELPANFPDVAKTPRFLYGDRLRWLSNESDTDWGIVIGRFYSFASHLCAWSWCYLIWLSKDCPSAAWTSADIAWEEDLAPISEETH